MNTNTTTTAIINNTNNNPANKEASENKRMKRLEFYVKHDYRIFIDTCALLDPAFPAFMERVTPLLTKYDNKIIVPIEVNKELINLYDKKPELRERVLYVLDTIKRNEDNVFRIMGDENDPFPDNLFHVLCSRFRTKYNLLFITQDRSLAADLLNMNMVESVKAKPVAVKRIFKDGNLENHYLAMVNGFYVAEKLKSNEMFRACSEATDIPDDLVPVSEVPGKGDVVFAKRPTEKGYAMVELGECISSGGEGTVYRTNTEFVAKIYLKDKVTARRRDKVLLMSSKYLNVKGVCFPVMSLFNSLGEFVGYLMREAHGKELGKSAFLPYLRNEHPDWKKEDQVKLCLTILDRVRELRKRNILIGDINPANILVESPEEIFFVDTDSYQIENYPCPVGQIYYTAPEIQGRKFDTFLRTQSNENFALSVLLFQILMAGKHPYSHAGNGGIAENIRGMEFPYNLGDEGTKRQPDGDWKYMWSHFQYDIKDAFFHTFWKHGTYSKEKDRLEIGEWYKRMSKYLDLLQNGCMEATDPMSLTLYPNRAKAIKNSEWTKCSSCGERIPYIKGKFKPKYCSICLTKAKEVLICEDCGAEFTVPISEWSYLKEKGYPLPKRCPLCREQRKMKQAVRAAIKPKRDYGSLVFNMDHPGALPPKSAAEPQPVTKPSAAPEPKPEPKSAPEPKPEPKSAPEPKPEPKPAPEPKPEPKPVPEPKPEPKPVPEPKSEPKPAATSQPANKPMYDYDRDDWDRVPGRGLRRAISGFMKFLAS